MRPIDDARMPRSDTEQEALKEAREIIKRLIEEMKATVKDESVPWSLQDGGWVYV